MNVSYEQIGYLSVTIPAGTCQAGQVCKVGSDGKAAVCSAGDRFCGVAETIRGGYAGVQIHGFAPVHYTGTVPDTGYVNLSADGAGGVKVDASGASYLAIQVDTASGTVTIEL